MHTRPPEAPSARGTLTGPLLRNSRVAGSSFGRAGMRLEQCPSYGLPLPMGSSPADTGEKRNEERNGDWCGQPGLGAGHASHPRRRPSTSRQPARAPEAQRPTDRWVPAHAADSGLFVTRCSGGK